MRLTDVLLDPAGFDALRADGNSPGALCGINAHPLQIGEPYPARLVLGMGDVVTGLRALATDFTFSGHYLFSLTFCWYGAFWCRSRDLNPDGRSPPPPQDGVSAKFHHFGTISVC